MGNSNEDRAENVYFALVAYRDEAAHGVETTAIDLISDLFHLANQEAWAWKNHPHGADALRIGSRIVKFAYRQPAKEYGQTELTPEIHYYRQ
jgi:hypothetical protein